jgi:hypothetical protein
VDGIGWICSTYGEVINTYIILVKKNREMATCGSYISVGGWYYYLFQRKEIECETGNNTNRRLAFVDIIMKFWVPLIFT